MQTILEEHGLKPKRIEVLDSSMLRDFVNCPSMFYLKHILGLRPRAADPRKTIALDWGSVWHEGLYTYYSPSGGLEAALERIDELFPSHITPENDSRIKRSRERMLKQMVAYHNKWKEDNKRYEIIRREQFFDVFSEEDDLRWCGRMDSIRRQSHPGKVQVWDYKTTSAMGDRYFDQHELSFQFPGYVWASNQIVTDTILELKMDVMYTLSKSFDFFRRTFRYDAFRLKEFVTNTKMWVDRIMYMQDNFLFEPEMWAKNWDECTRYNTCMFFPVHSIHPKGDTRLRVLQNNYHEDRWDPSAIHSD
jgi:RecB family exonuclease